MKIKIMNLICTIILICSMSILVACRKKDEEENEKKYVDYLQEMDYFESIDCILNPDQGFYRTSTLKLNPDDVKSSLSYDEKFQLYHLRIDISGFSKTVNKKEDLVLTQNALNELEQSLKFYLEKEKNVIVRFCYDKDFGGNANLEPSIDMMLTHIEQVCMILNQYIPVLTAIEVGMIGPWGEMHTSNVANSKIINQLIDAFLNYTMDIPILVRTPEMIYNYLGITINDIFEYRIDKNHKAYRLGMFNDGYLGSESDLGTYKKRNEETTWLSFQTNHLPYGGEVTIPNSSMHDINLCLPEMFKLHLSYLNYEWNNSIVQNKWCQTFYSEDCGNDALYYGHTAFDYIQNHFGYRLVLKKSMFSLSPTKDKLNISLELNNVGFGNLWRKKDISIILVGENSSFFINGIGTYSGEDTITALLNISQIESGYYKVYLSINSKIEENYIYPIYFANPDIIDYNLKANYIGTFQK